MSVPMPPAPRSHRFGRHLAAAGVSASVAVLFLTIALPLGRNARTHGAEAPARQLPAELGAKPNAAEPDDDAILSGVDGLARESQRDPRAVLAALDPLLRVLATRAPEETKLALERWRAAAQTAER